MIELKNINYKYSPSSENILENVSATIEDGRIYGLMGQNGVGKTTMLKLCAGLLLAKEGKVMQDGLDVSARSVATLEEVYYTSEKPDMPKKSVKDYAKMIAPFYPRFSMDELKRCMDEFGMSLDAKMNKVSQGEQRKIQISLAMAVGTKHILLDEPTNGLDITSKDTFRKIISRNATDGRTIVMSTHLVHDIEQLVDSLIIVGKKNILLDMTTTEVASKYCFGTAMGSSTPSGTIFSEKCVGGTRYVKSKAADDDETEVDIELLYKAIVEKEMDRK